MKLRSIVGRGPIDLKRPKGVSDEQWAKAVSLYRAAENVGDKFPEITVAQAALETGWFKKESGKNNFFGQKATSSQKGSDIVTHEVKEGQKVKITDRFRDYDSIEEALIDRKNKWMSKYDSAATADEAISKIWQLDEKKNQGKGYATDPKYGGKIQSILSMMGVDSAQIKYKNNVSKETTKVAIDNTAVRKPKIPSLATPPINPTYTALPEDKKETEEKQIAGISESKLRQILEAERKQNEQRFLTALSQKQEQPEQDYSPQYQPEDLSYLYNYIKLQD